MTFVGIKDFTSATTTGTGVALFAKMAPSTRDFRLEVAADEDEPHEETGTGVEVLDTGVSAAGVRGPNVAVAMTLALGAMLASMFSTETDRSLFLPSRLVLSDVDILDITTQHEVNSNLQGREELVVVGGDGQYE